VQQGHRFSIVASDLNYLTGQRTVAQKGLVIEQDFDGVRVFRAYTYPSLHRSFSWRVVSFFSFMFTAIWAALLVGPVDLVMGTSPPIFQAVSAWMVAVLRRCPFLLEIRDLWPEFAIDIGVLRNPALIALSRWLERFLYARATHILVNSPAYRDYLVSKGVSAAKISLISNGVDPHMFNVDSKGGQLRQMWGLNGSFVVTYAGALGLANDIPTILGAASRLREQCNVHFLIVGDGKERSNLEALAQQLQLPNVTFTGAQPKSEMPEILAASDACIATLKNIPMFRTTYPNKVFDYMAAGRPTILAIDGVIRQVIEAANGGIFVPPGDDAVLAEAVQALNQDPQRAQVMGKAARAYVAKHFNRHQQAEQFAGLVQHLAMGKADRTKKHWYLQVGKRLLDLALVIPALVLFFPILLLVALLVYLKLGRPIFFHQMRPGLHGKSFALLKFRTMTDARDAEGRLLPDPQRLTRFGLFLRSTSLDELPQLINVLKGEMSIVGPRPLLVRYLNRYTREQMRRHEVKPGITGWAQVHGRNDTTWKERFERDVWYVDHCSLTLDCKIILATVAALLRDDGGFERLHQLGEYMGPDAPPNHDWQPIDSDGR
jgi:lipopolysaccharide/colanic/teichoic acid biosynthesis glycosyltransferase